MTFLSAQKEGDLKCEYLIPTVVDDMLKKQLADVQVLETRDRWFGVTYAEDKAYVTDSIQALVKGGSTLKTVPINGLFFSCMDFC